ncbi:MAG TPA: nitroreductase family protein [Longimicrobiaceae bacterium]|jgi:nitroreductase
MADIATDILSVREAAAQRRSIRAYEQEPIPHADIEEILDVVRLAPSAFNVQPWRFVVVERPEMKQRLAAAAYNQRQVTSAPAVIVLYTDMADTLATVDEVLHPGMPAAQQAAARDTLLRTFGSQTEAEREAWAAGQGNIALGYLLLAAEAHGYQTSPMAGFDAEQVKALLGLSANVRIPALVAIGRGAEEGFPHHRHELERIVRYA